MSKYAAIVLSAGVGSRMKSDIPKQYMDLAGKPVIYYSLKAFEDAGFSSIVLVCGKDDVEYCQEEIVNKHKLKNVTAIVPGGKERYHSVYEGLKAVGEADYVFIHDGARPMLTQEIIERLKVAVAKEEAAVAGMPVKDTIKIVDEESYVSDTPERQHVWQVQTPQAFSYELVFDAYTRMLEANEVGITDDAMVVERMTDYKVKLIEGSYRNIKITTPEDLLVAAAYLKK